MKAPRSTIANNPVLDTRFTSTVGAGWKRIRDMLARAIEERGGTSRAIRLGIDGYPGTDWSAVETMAKELLDESIGVDLIDIRTYELPGEQSAKLMESCLPADEPVFGRIYPGTIRDFFAESDLERIRDRINNAATRDRRLVVCFGPGTLQTALADCFDINVYLDCTREVALKRNRVWTKKTGKTQSVGPRQTYYVDFPVHDRNRRSLLKHLDFYVDGNNADTPKILPGRVIRQLIGSLTEIPLRIKPLYEPGVWGGQWLKENRELDKSMVNCAYGFEIIAPEQSVLAKVGKHQIELPFNLLMEAAGVGMVGASSFRRFGTEFPIRFAYDDTWGGDNLSIQVHPTTRYMKSTFNERLHQAEMYYIFDAKPGAISHLGLKKGVTKERFLEAARTSERNRIKINHREFVNVVPAKKGDILLIPPGTVHGAGADEIVLEISSTPYRYTFKIYDYCRPNLDGSFRPIHLEHAFNVIKFFRDEKWVAENLMPKPELLEHGSHNGESWDEFVIADRREFLHVVNRIEFDAYYRTATNGKFHLLNLVEGEKVRINSTRSGKSSGEQSREMAYSETVLIPANVGRYEVINVGSGPCKVVKSFLRG